MTTVLEFVCDMFGRIITRWPCFTSISLQGNFCKIMASEAVALPFVLLDQKLNSAYIWQLEILSNCQEPYCSP